MMTSRERVLTTLSHREPDCVPLTLAYETPEAILKRYDKTESDLSVPMRQDVGMVRSPATPPDPSVRERYFRDIELPSDARIDAWGVARWHSPTGESHSVVGPLRHAETIDDLEAFPWPGIEDDSCIDALSSQVSHLHAQHLASMGGGCSIFEQSWYLTGMEKLMMAFHTDADFVSTLFDKVTERMVARARHAALAGVDILQTGDDIAGQKGMLISPDLWRQTLKPRLAKVIEVAREVSPDIGVFYHSDGAVGAVIEDLIEVGVTILNPIQPEVMDPFHIKRAFGDRITLWGTVGTQSTLPFGTPKEVCEVVRNYCKTLGQGGGYVIAPTHAIKEDVPWENIRAFYEAVETYGSLS